MEAKRFREVVKTVTIEGLKLGAVALLAYEVAVNSAPTPPNYADKVDTLERAIMDMGDRQAMAGQKLAKDERILNDVVSFLKKK